MRSSLLLAMAQPLKGNGESCSFQKFMFNSREDDREGEVRGKIARITETPFARQHKPGKQKTNFPGRKVEE